MVSCTCYQIVCRLCSVSTVTPPPRAHPRATVSVHYTFQHLLKLRFRSLRLRSAMITKRCGLYYLGCRKINRYDPSVQTSRQAVEVTPSFRFCSQIRCSWKRSVWAARRAAQSERAQRDGGPAFHSLNGPRKIKCHFSSKLKDNRKYKEELVNECCVLLMCSTLKKIIIYSNLGFGTVINHLPRLDIIIIIWKLLQTLVQLGWSKHQIRMIPRCVRWNLLWTRPVGGRPRTWWRDDISNKSLNSLNVSWKKLSAAAVKSPHVILEKRKLSRQQCAFNVRSITITEGRSTESWTSPLGGARPFSV